MAATRLFAARGFAGVRTRDIAAAAGLNMATIAYHHGTKGDLYHAVFRRLADRERRLAGELVASLRDEPLDGDASVARFADRVAAGLVEMTAEYPGAPRLWMRRWLAGPDDPEGIEADCTVPVLRVFEEIIDRFAAATGRHYRGPSPTLLIKSVVWILYGYFTDGPLDWKTARRDPADPAGRAELRRFLADYLCRMLAVPSPYEPGRET